MKIYLNEPSYKHEVFELIRSILGEETEFTNLKSEENLLYMDVKDNTVQIKYIIKSKEVYKSVVNNVNKIIEDTFTKKMLVKSEVIKFIKIQFGKTNSWGVLTGIRPVKIAKKYLLNHSRAETLNYLENKLLLNKEKAQLITDVAINQNKYISTLKNKSFSIYINIPFCPTRCDYCSYATLRLNKHGDKVDSYLEVLKKEISSMLDILNIDNLNTVYIGGGTPTSLNNKQLENLLLFLNDNIENLTEKEFTVEAGREDTLDFEKLKILKKNGVNRISLNPQTFNNETLKLIGRKQDNKKLMKRYYEIKKLAFNSVNMDLILGLPKENRDSLVSTFKFISELQPDNLTVHTLSVKKGSKLKENSIELEEEKSNVENMMEYVKKFAMDNGYIPYYMYRQKQILGNMENIGFAKKNKECIYNITMMEEEENIVGVGMGSSTKLIDRKGLIINHRNYKNMRDYINNIDLLIGKKERLIGEIND